MTSVSAFTEMMGQFLMELHKTFPEEKGLKKCISAFELMKDINLEKHWDSCSENTKNAIWQYVQTLYMLGTTIKSIPEDTLSMIESVAKQCADKMGEDGSELDEAALMKTMQGMLGGMLGGNKK